MTDTVDIREDAEVVDYENKHCIVCGEDLSLVHGHREDKGICKTCGFPYSVNPSNGSVGNVSKSLLYSTRSVSADQLRCLMDFWEDTEKPAPLWSYSPFTADLFLEFDEWTRENGYDEFSWA